MHATNTAAETGHLVIGTVHTVDASKTVDRIVDIFPSDQQSHVLTQLSNSLVAVVSQRLLPRADGEGRVLAVETMIANAGIRACIRDRKPHMILGLIEIGMNEGMITLDESLITLLKTGQITLEEALIHARDPDRVRSAVPVVAAKKKSFFG
jgi:twitching motility protein PilT